MGDIKIEDFTLKIDLGTLVGNLSAEESRQLMKTFALQSDIVDSVVKYICGEDDDGSWTSEAPELRQKILQKIERVHVDGLADDGPRYGWQVWADIQGRLRDIKCKKHIYWALYHDEYLHDKHGWGLVRDFFKRHKIESDYTTKEADADIEEVKKMIRDAMAKMKLAPEAKEK